MNKREEGSLIGKKELRDHFLCSLPGHLIK